MKKHLLLFISLLSFATYSQISFESGYYVDNNNQKIPGLIKNMDWANNPVEFVFKSSENQESIKIPLKSAKEFGINDVSKYVRSTVKMDRSGENMNTLSREKNPIFEEEELFLKVLVEGEASLFQYVDGNLRRYFYNKNDSEIEQLIFKRFRISQSEIASNNQFQQQLWTDLKCEDFKISKIEKLEYKKNPLVKYFIDYNSCNNHDYINYEKNQKRNPFHLTIRPRLNSSSLTIQNSLDNSKDSDFGNKIGFGLGLEAEYVFPFNKNKWSLLVEPAFQSFKVKNTRNVNNVSGGILIAKVNYSSIEIPVGARHYFFLNDHSKIFINASYVINMGLNKSVDFYRKDGSNLSSLDIKPANNFAFGLGYKFDNRYSAEFRYQTTREIFDNYFYWSSDYKTMSFILGYTIF